MALQTDSMAVLFYSRLYVSITSLSSNFVILHITYNVSLALSIATFPASTASNVAYTSLHFYQHALL